MQDNVEPFLPHHFRDVISFWHHESTPAFNVLAGSIGLLSRGYAGTLTEEQQELVNHAAQYIARAQRCWHHLVMYSMLCEYDTFFSVQANTLPEVIHHVTASLASRHPYVSIETQFPDDLPLIASDGLLPAALINLVYPEDELHQTSSIAAAIAITLDTQQIPVIHITTQHIPRTLEWTKLDPAYLHAGGCLWNAAVCLRQHGSQVDVHTTHDHTHFTFSLPVWRENE